MMQKYRLALAITWLTGGGLILLTMIIQTTLGHYGEDSKAAWDWLSPNLVPTMTLVLGITTLTKPGQTPERSDLRSLFMIAMGVSIFYLVALALPILLHPLVDSPSIEVLRTSTLWLGLLQGGASTVLGVFFTREAPAAPGKDTPAAADTTAPAGA